MKLLFREQILEASKFVVDSSSGPGNKANHWADSRSRVEGVRLAAVRLMMN